MSDAKHTTRMSPPGLAGRILAADWARLVAAAPDERIGLILRLNQASGYANRLNAVELLSLLMEASQPIGCGAQDGVSDWSPAFPGPSDSQAEGTEG